MCISEVISISSGNLDPACASSSPAFCMMYFAYKLNKQSDNIELWCTLFQIWTQSVIPCPVLLLLDLHTDFSGKKKKIQKDTCTPIFIVSPFTMPKIWQPPKCPSRDEEIKKILYTSICIQIYNGTLLSHKKNEIMPFAATWMDL